MPIDLHFRNIQKERPRAFLPMVKEVSEAIARPIWFYFEKAAVDNTFMEGSKASRAWL